MFTLTIVSPKALLFEGQVKSVFLPGDKGEFEVLLHHAPIVSLLKEGTVVVDWERAIRIKKGIVKFFNNDCVILVDE